MGYINKKTRYIIEQMKYQRLPENWNMYIYDLGKKHNLIIKNKNQYYCTNCHAIHTYKNNDGPKIKQKMFCRMCGNTYFVRSNKLKNWKMTDDIILLDKVENELVVRVFEMRSEYNSKKIEVAHSTVEYARKIVDDNYREIRNDRVSIAQCGPWVLHKKEEGNWRPYDGYYYESPSSGYLYFDNLKNILKDTRFEKSRLWELAKVYKDDYLNIEELLSAAKYESFECLIEMKLYQLAFDARSFICKGSFKKIFGIDKTYYQFMKKHNISSGELSMLRKYPTRDIRKLRFLIKYKYTIDEITRYTTVENFITYFRKKRLKDAHLYRDYLDFAKKLGLNLKNKKYLFPDRLKTMHDKYEKQLEQIKQDRLQKRIQARAESLSKNIFKNKKYIVFPATSINAMVDESTQQDNCVRTYVDRYAEGTCDIYFMRLISDTNKSLVTIEVRENKVVQKRIKGNKPTTEEQDKFIEKWQKRVLQKAV